MSEHRRVDLQASQRDLAARTRAARMHALRASRARHDPAQAPDPGNGGIPARRVKHLVVLPGGAAERDGEGAVQRRAAQDHVAEDAASSAIDAARGQPLRRDAGPGAASGPTAQAAVAEAVAFAPVEALAPSSFKVKLKIISRSVSNSRRPGTPFILFASVVVTLAVFTLVLLRVMVDQSSFKVDYLQSSVTQQHSNLTELRYQDSLAISPERIAAVAATLGLVPGGDPQVLVGPGSPAPTAGTSTQGGAQGGAQTAAQKAAG